MNTATDSLETQTPKTGGGYLVGQSATDLVGFFGATPVVQPTSTSQSAIVQAAITDGTSGSASATSGVQALTSGYNSAILANALATIIAGSNQTKALVTQLRLDLISLGLIKGS